jgi:hypothetical protein
MNLLQKKIVTGCAILLPLFSVSSYAQSPTGLFESGNNHPGQNSLTSLEEQQQELAMRKILALNNDRAMAKKEVEGMIASTNLACQSTAAFLVGEGKAKAQGRTIATKIYETSCSNGMGYLFETQDTKTPRIVSCFAAAASSTTNGKAEPGRTEREDGIGFNCQMKANEDIKSMAASLLSSFAPSCTVSDVQWLGISSTERTEYTEVRCADGAGYVLEVPRINSTAAVLATTCQDAAELGLQCRLSSPGQVAQPVTMQTYLDALKDNGLACEPVQLRLIGREHSKKRYVVEAQCEDHPRGIVAYLPLNGNPNPFEMTDCTTAKARKVQCKFVSHQ